ncbi:Hsp70 family protein [Pseudomonas sp. R5(2019)]|uniref:Hsp70 family protein n=1 Tax=Pseudomonas sp. R5(2019) TaxID=2697566 RepID=UPI00141288DF|nr:Hsp70 family protein [Pseudomonas sp. R5(2019)]NBA97689.1 Hsp70 family protein [Pseudomonas sp. R5(2019)]
MIVGIDLGTTHSLIAAWREGAPQLVANALGDFLTPSVVGLDDEGRVMVGRAARERLQTHPQLTAALFKRAMGSARAIRLGEQAWRAEELSALVLRSLREDAERQFGEPVSAAVISVPAYFSDAQRKATRIAGELAGLKVLRLVNEPTAAALAHGLQPQAGDACFLVFDLGGGTFDVSVLELFDGVMEVRASAGDNFLGGEDFDTLLVQAFIAAQNADPPLPDLAEPRVAARLRREAERVRHALGQQVCVTFSLCHDDQQWRRDFHQEELPALYAPLLARLRTPIETALADARIRPAELDDVLLVGGATRMPQVRKLVAGLFSRLPSLRLDPDHAVALGAAVQAALASHDAALDEVVMTDVCPYSLGIETSINLGTRVEPGHFLPIIERNSVVPVSRVRRVMTLHDQQTEVLLKVYQGESRWVCENIYLGEVCIEVPPRPAGEISLQVRFSYDHNGLLEAEVDCPLLGEKRRLVIQNNPGVLTADEVEQRLEALAALKIHPREQQANTLLIARLEHLYQASLGTLRERIDLMTSHFEQVLDSQDEQQIKDLRQQLNARLEALEQGGWP